MQVEVYTSTWSHSIDKSSVAKAVKHLLEKISCELVIVQFVGKKKIQSLHKKYFSDPSPTDCITFPIDPPDKKCHVLGEIFICLQVAKEYAKKHAIPLEEEITLYLIHGILHLLGYDDLEPKEKERMRKKEKSCMKLLKKHHATIRLSS